MPLLQDDRPLTITDMIIAIANASPEQKAQLAEVLGTVSGVSKVNEKTGDVVLVADDIAGVVSETDLAADRTLTHVFGRAGTNELGEQALAGMIQLSHLAPVSTGSILMRTTAGTGAWQVGNAAAMRTLLDFANTGKDAYLAAAQAQGDDAILGKSYGIAALKAIKAAVLDGTTQAEARTLLSQAFIVWSTTNFTDGHQIVGVQNATTRVGSVLGLSADGTISDLAAGTEDIVVDAATLKAFGMRRTVSSSGGALHIDFAAGWNCFMTTTQNFDLTFTAPPHVPGVLIIHGGGAHTVTIDADFVSPESLGGEFTVASGKVYILTFLDDGTTQTVTVSSTGAAPA